MRQDSIYIVCGYYAKMIIISARILISTGGESFRDTETEREDDASWGMIQRKEVSG